MSELGSSRHLARERALEILYEAQMKERSVADVLATLPVSPDPYASTLALATESSRARARKLRSAAPHVGRPSPCPYTYSTDLGPTSAPRLPIRRSADIGRPSFGDAAGLK